MKIIKEGFYHLPQINLRIREKHMKDKNLIELILRIGRLYKRSSVDKRKELYYKMGFKDNKK